MFSIIHASKTLQNIAKSFNAKQYTPSNAGTPITDLPNDAPIANLFDANGEFIAQVTAGEFRYEQINPA